jgi:hypothetical protein
MATQSATTGGQGILNGAVQDPNAPNTQADLNNNPSVTGQPQQSTISSAVTPNVSGNTQPSYNPSTDVSSWYTSELGRHPDAAGLSYWDQQLASGQNPNQVKNNFELAAIQNGETINGHGAQTYKPAILSSPTAFTVQPNQTVQGQLTGLMDPNSPLIQQAETRANQQANSRGLLNSSIANTGAQEAAYAAAIPIATTDAATYNNAAGYNANESNIFAMQNANAQNAAGQFGANANNTLMGEQLGANTQTSIANGNQATQQQIAQMQTNAQKSFYGASDATQLANNYQAAIAQIGSLNMDEASKQALQNNIFSAYQQAVAALDQKLGIPNTSGMLSFNPAPVTTPTAPATNNGASSGILNGAAG